jgi:hypothetical protein
VPARGGEAAEEREEIRVSDPAELVDERESGGGAGPVEHEVGGLDGLVVPVVPRWKNGRDAGADGAAPDPEGAFSVNQGDVPDPDARDVGDGVVRPRIAGPDDDAEVPRAGAVISVSALFH